MSMDGGGRELRHMQLFLGLMSKAGSVYSALRRDTDILLQSGPPWARTRWEPSGDSRQKQNYSLVTSASPGLLLLSWTNYQYFNPIKTVNYLGCSTCIALVPN